MNPSTVETALIDLAAEIAQDERRMAAKVRRRDVLICRLRSEGQSLRYIAGAAGLRSENSVRKILAKKP